MEEATRPRPSDLAVSSNRNLLAMLLLIWRARYEKHTPNNFGSALELMLVSFAVSVATSEGKPIRSTEISRMLVMPNSNVDRHLRKLVSTGRIVRAADKTYLADLEHLDSLVTPDVADGVISILDLWAADMRRLRSLVFPKL